MATVVLGQELERKTVHIKEASSKIVVDGYLNEQAWNESVPAKDFMQTFPYDSSMSYSQCEIYMTYDKHYIYLGTKCNDTDPSKDFVTLSMRRDFRGPGIESINLILDPFLDQTNAFAFGINPLGIQKEGLVANGGNQGDDFSLDWDNK